MLTGGGQRVGLWHQMFNSNGAGGNAAGGVRAVIELDASATEEMFSE